MEWRKEVKTHHVKSFDIIAITVAVLFFVGIITGQLFVFLVAGVLSAHLVLMKVFDRNVLNKLKLENQKRTLRLFPGEETTLFIKLKNESIFPLIHGELTWNMGRQVKINEQRDDSERVVIPASLPARRKVEIQVPIQGVRRGTTSITQVTYRFNHLFNFHSAHVYYKPDFETEIIVYPELKRVQGVESVFHMLPGTAPQTHSPFEDILDPIGTRDYTYSDSFQRINWKASARSNTLQTNIYQHVVDRSYLFLVNLKTDMQPGMLNQVEDLISYAAYLCHYAAKDEQQYELMLNVLRPGQTYIHQHEGTGRVQLAKSLELLARIPTYPVTESFESMLYQVTKFQRQPKTIVILGPIPEESYLHLKQLLAFGHSIYILDRQEEVAAITRLRLEKIA